ncbi:UNVERIFIED_CONTAM: hypothetical protein PYX00_005857 [Menopon gallinae]|uniref:Reverse transcriptase n=1 Tax=Menopon gallinae TaxID=328185 RepID=A0AAW2HU71_9NEOP
MRSLYEDCRRCVRINVATSERFRVVVGFHQKCMLSPVLLITYMDRMLKKWELQIWRAEAGHLA